MEGWTNRRWIYVKRPEGEVTREHYRLEEESVGRDEVGADEILVRARYISVDPYMRIQQSANQTWEEPHPLDTVQGGGMVGEVVVSNDSTGRIALGDVVSVYTGWQMYGRCAAEAAVKLDESMAPASTALGVLGMPARTAYFGLLEAGKPKAGETLLVSGAAGAVGSIVGQIGKIQGCRVVGTAGSPEKVEFLTRELGFDAAVDYRAHPTAEGIREALRGACPDGIDVYFDNVGGIITDAVFELMNVRARIVICGQISQYSGGLDAPALGPRLLHHVLYKRATIQGVLARDFTPRMEEMLETMGPWVRDGKIRYRETFVDGFEKLPEALNMLFHGANTGKLVVRV